MIGFLMTILMFRNVSPKEASCAAGAPFRMKRNSMDSAATLGRKDSNSESDLLIKAAELEKEAVFGRLEEPLIVAPYLEARRGNSHVERRPVGDLSGEMSDQFSGGTAMEVVYPRCGGLSQCRRAEWKASQRTATGLYHDL